MVNAWVFVIWGDLKYIIGAIAAAESLRLVSTKQKIVLLYANMTVPIKELKPLFDEVKKVAMLEFEYTDLRTKRQKELYGGEYSKQINTKWQCISLENYNKVMYVDSDIIFQHNSDELFDLATPAACFSNAFAEPYVRGGIKNVYGPLKQGDKIPPATVLKGLNGSFSGNGAMSMYTPSKKILKDYILWMKSKEPYGHPESFSGIDEQCISEYYALRGYSWTHMHQKYQFVPWKANWLPESKNSLSDAYGLHYFHSKPWEQGEGADWPDVKRWWDKYHAFEKSYPGLAKIVRPYITFYSGGKTVKKSIKKKSTKKKSIKK